MCMNTRKSKQTLARGLVCAPHTKVLSKDKSTEKQPCSLNFGFFKHPENN